MSGWSTSGMKAALGQAASPARSLLIPEIVELDEADVERARRARRASSRDSAS